MGGRFDDQVERGAERLDGLAARLSAGAVEVAGVGDAFAQAVQQFGESNARMLDQLQRIESALERSLARSDEQLAYYVAQAREVIDLSMLSQKQIIEDLQQIAAPQAAAGGGTA